MEKKVSIFNLEWSEVSKKSSDQSAAEISDEMWFKGYASVFDVLDEHNDVVCQGAFKDCLESENYSKIKLLWQHNIEEIVGKIDVAYEDENGLIIEGRILRQLNRGKDLCYLIQKNTISTMSIGYRVLDFFIDQDIRYITKIDLLEASFVTFPANPNATLLDYGYNNIDKN